MINPESAVKARKYRIPRVSLRRLVFLWIPGLTVAVSLLLPILYLGIRASDGNGRAIENLVRPGTIRILFNSFALAGSVLTTTTLIALPLAWLTVRTDLPFRRLWAVLTALPLVIPSYIGAFLMVSSLGPRGLVQSWLAPLGVDRLPSIYGFPGALLILTLLSYPYLLLSLRASLMGIDPSLEDAARILGLSPWKSFIRVILPQLRPGLVSGGLLVLLYTLKDFGAVAVMRFDTFTRAIYVQYQSLIDRTGAAALSMLLIGITVLILVFEFSLRNNKTQLSTPGTRHRAVVVPLGPWRTPAVIFCGLITIFSLILPTATLLYWFFRGIFEGQTIPSLWIAAGNSLLVSGLAGVITLAVAMPIAILSSRHPNRYTNIVEGLSYVGFGLPGVVVALALVFFGVTFLPIFYQTLPLLLLGYVILFLPIAIGAVKTSLLQIHPSMEEAGRSLGSHPIRVFFRITFPIVRPGLAAGGGMVFLTVMKELPATLILSPIGFRTLATSVWGAVSEAFFTQASLPALLLILLSSIPMAYLVLRDG